MHLTKVSPAKLYLNTAKHPLHFFDFHDTGDTFPYFRTKSLFDIRFIPGMLSKSVSKEMMFRMLFFCMYANKKQSL